MTPGDRGLYRIGEVEVDTGRACLRRSGTEQPLRPKSFQVLLFLLENRSRLVTREELLEHAWNGAAVSEDVLTQSITELRRAFGDDSRNPRYLKTIPKLGYRFIGEVEELAGFEGAVIEVENTTAVQVEVRQEFPQPLVLKRRWLYGIAAALALAAGGAAVYQLAPRQQVELALRDFAGKTPVAVMFFENRSGEPELDWLREGLADMLITNLARAPKLAVLGREQVRMLLERGGHAPRTAIGLEQALQVARRGRAEIVILGAFTSLGETIRLDVQVYQARGGHLLAGESVSASRTAGLLGGFDALSVKLAAQLGAALPGGGRRAVLTEARTSHLEAFRAYSLGVELAEQIHSAEALTQFRKALEIDPAFAMAQARIGYVYSVAWSRPADGKPYLEQAFRSQQALTPRDRLYIAAWYALANEDYAAAIRAYRAIIAEFPADTDPYLSLGRILRGEQRYAEARDVLQRGLVIDPEDGGIHSQLGVVYFELGLPDQAIASVRRCVELNPSEPNAHDSLGLIYQRAGRYQQAIESYRKAQQLNLRFEPPVIHLGNTYLQLGRYRDAIAQYERYRQIAPSDFELQRARLALARVYWLKGDLRQAEAQLALRWPDLQNAHPFSLLVAVELGKVPAAIAIQRLEREINAGGHPNNRGARHTSREDSYYRGHFELRRGRPEEATKNFAQALRESAPYWSPNPMEDCLANAYLQLGKLNEAIAEYRRILRINPNDARVRYHLGEALERTGNLPAAKSEFDRFLEIWKDADADAPEVSGARQHLASLQPAAARAWRDRSRD